MAESVINRDPEILNSAPVFVGTRVPIRILFKHLKAGDSLDVLLEDFPSVTREQAPSLLDLALEHLTGSNQAAA